MAWFDCAVHRPIQGGTSGPLTAQRGLVLHHAVATGSLFNTFNNGKVSTQFWVSRSGTIEQYLDSTQSAWATGNNIGNMQYNSVETEGCNVSPYAEPMTPEMVDGLSRLYKEGNARHGWPFQLANSAGTNGFAYHRLFYNTACPCDVRVDRRHDILILAQGGGTPTPTPPQPSPPSTGHPPFPGTNLVDYTAGHGTSTWQAQMSHRGWSISVDDQYGPQSANVCRQFQSEKGLGVDGIVGPITWDAAWTAPIT
jgi:peptidoglycan hydrolase-like protein with peptidoglycan-binding domain